MPNLYLLNSPVIKPRTAELCVYVRKVTPAYAKTLVDEFVNIHRFNLVSAIGHASTARLLSRILGIDVPVSRAYVEFDFNDHALVISIKTRLEPGRELSDEELEKIEYELLWIASRHGVVCR